mmetsp:Transcript_3912/g.5166  ORF Transcript_3912/g.5166 Transcript_3912/m.5166 type:complete len:148 (-) Transcript_3912:210-653(-)
MSKEHERNNKGTQNVQPQNFTFREREIILLERDNMNLLDRVFAVTTTIPSHIKGPEVQRPTPFKQRHLDRQRKAENDRLRSRIRSIQERQNALERRETQLKEKMKTKKTSLKEKDGKVGEAGPEDWAVFDAMISNRMQNIQRKRANP